MHIHVFREREQIQSVLPAEMRRTIHCFCVFFLCFLALFTPSYSGAITPRRRNVPAMFVFGDSIVDGGNNVFVDPNCTTDSLPYGIDFPTGPTGRFTNGRNPSDILSQLLRIPRFLPAAKDPKTIGGMILYGVNYASGGSGILDRPAAVYISLNQQIKHFQTITIPDLRTQFNNTGKLSSYLAKSIFVFNSGGNDCAQECSGSVRKEKCASDEFLESLLANFTHQLKVHDFISFGIFCQSTAGAIHPYLTFQEQRFCKLLNSGVYWRVFLQIVYDLGARKFVLFGIQANGCNPGCINDASEGQGSISFYMHLPSNLGASTPEL